MTAPVITTLKFSIDEYKRWENYVYICVWPHETQSLGEKDDAKCDATLNL